MDRAKDRRNEQEYTAIQISQLDPGQRRELKPHLRCPYCQSIAHFRSASRPSARRRGSVAHFYCLPHGEECDITRSYADPWETDESDRTVAEWQQRNITLLVRILVTPKGGPDEAPAAEAGAEGESQSGRGGERTRRFNLVSRGPQKLLEHLVHWPSFKTSTTTLRMPDPNRTELPVHDAFVGFEAARLGEHTAQWHGFWGIVRPLTYWSLGETYFSNFGASNTSFRIAIHRTVVPNILERYKLRRIEDLTGHYLLLFDHARESTSGRFIAEVNSINHIGFLRVGYRSP